MHGHIRERKEIPKYVKPQTSQFYYAEAHKCYTWLAGFCDLMVIYAFLLEFFFLVILIKKSYMSVKYKRLLNYTHHKHEPQSSLA